MGAPMANVERNEQFAPLQVSTQSGGQNEHTTASRSQQETDHHGSHTGLCRIVSRIGQMYRISFFHENTHIPTANTRVRRKGPEPFGPRFDNDTVQLDFVEPAPSSTQPVG